MNREKAEESIFSNAIHTVSRADCDELTKGTKYCLSGFLNAETKMIIKSEYNATIFRIPVLNWDGCQFVIDVWTKNRSQEPRVAVNWEVLQWTIMRGVVFIKKVQNYGHSIYHFKINTSNDNHRFIWLSDPDRNFWLTPVAEPEDPQEIRQWYVQRGDSATVRGIIKSSKGSCFGKSVSDKDRTIHTHTMIGGMFFADWKEYMIMYRRKVTRRFFELMMVEGELISIDQDRLPLFHR